MNELNALSAIKQVTIDRLTRERDEAVGLLREAAMLLFEGDLQPTCDCNWCKKSQEFLSRPIIAALMKEKA